jgi:hypothetical protein
VSVLGRSICALALLVVVSGAQAAEPRLPRDGWVTWQAPAVDNAPAWCCFSQWKQGGPAPVACKLDDHFGHGTGGRDETTEVIRIYARSTGGKLDRLRALAASCPVEAGVVVQELAGVTPEDSARWLIAQVRQDGSGNSGSSSEHAIGALALHRTEVAGNALAGFARGDSRIETRKQAMFWLAMVRGEQGAAVTSSVMFNDQNATLREHGAFAISQSRSPRIAADLIRLGNTDKVPDVRSKAWFWLAQSQVAEAEAALSTALRKDVDERVREEAVFALSQLPGERATRALIAVAEDQSLAREQRRRAVFWLSQSETDSAQRYLEKVLARTARK